MIIKFKPGDLITNGRGDKFEVKFVFDDTYEYGLVDLRDKSKNKLYKADTNAIDRLYHYLILNASDMWNELNESVAS